MPRRKQRKRCRWCKKDLDGKKHRGITESYCFILNEQKIRSRVRPRVRRIEDAYRDGKLLPELLGTDMERKLIKRQRRMAIDASLLSTNGYDPPRNVTYMSEQGFVYAQVSHEKPFAVIVLGKERPDGTRKRMVVRRNNLIAAVHAHRALSKKYKRVYIVSLVRGYDLPPQWRLKKSKLPKKFVWCPYCSDFRIYRRHPDQVRFSALKKVEKWSDKLNGYKFEWVERQVWLTACIVCGNTNRNSIYRRSNQPWELRHLKPSVTRVKQRKGAPSMGRGRKKKGVRRG